MGQDVSYFPRRPKAHRGRSSSREPLNNNNNTMGMMFKYPTKSRRKKRQLQKSQPVKQRFVEGEDDAQITSMVSIDKLVERSSAEKSEMDSEGPDLGWSSGEDFNMPPDLGWSMSASGEEDNFQGIQRSRSMSFYGDDENVERAMEDSAGEPPPFSKLWVPERLRLRHEKHKSKKDHGILLKPNELLALNQGLKDAGAARQTQSVDSSDIEEFDDDSQQRTVKILLIGDTGVGKSCIMSRFYEDKFSCNLPGTVGVDFAVRELDIAGEHVRVNCWDTPGQERYRTVTRSYYRGCHGVIIVYDVSVAHTFERVVYWTNNVKKNAGPNVNICLVGNKADMSSVVETEAAMKIAEEYEMDFFLTSAKTGENVYNAFMAIIKKCLQSSRFWTSLQQPNSKIVIPQSQVEDERPQDGQVQKRKWNKMCTIS